MIDDSTIADNIRWLLLIISGEIRILRCLSLRANCKRLCVCLCWTHSSTLRRKDQFVNGSFIGHNKSVTFYYDLVLILTLESRIKLFFFCAFWLSWFWWKLKTRSRSSTFFLMGQRGKILKKWIPRKTVPLSQFLSIYRIPTAGKDVSVHTSAISLWEKKANSVSSILVTPLDENDSPLDQMAKKK